MNLKKYADIEGVTSVIGNQEKMKFETYQNLLKSDQFSQILVNDIMEVRETASHLVSGFEGKARAFVQIQNGCNHRYTFYHSLWSRKFEKRPCGRNRCTDSTVDSKWLSRNCSNRSRHHSHGEDLPACPTLGQMIRRLLNSVPAIKRLRLSSLIL